MDNNIVTLINIENALKLLGRDCHVCGLNTQNIMKGKHYTPVSARIRFIKPLLEGGDHSWENTKIECSSCYDQIGTKKTLSAEELKEISAHSFLNHVAFHTGHRYQLID